MNIRKSSSVAALIFLLLLLFHTGVVVAKDLDTTPETAKFVTVDGTRFILEGEPYTFIGTNMWFGAYLGSTSKEYGDRERLVKELDLLKSLGITNLRILGASERSPLRDAMRPAISHKGKVEQDDILVGLDFMLTEMAKRDMKAVIFLNNFWEWSGGMATYLSWVKNGEIVDMADPEKPWPAFARFTAEFYSNDKAKQLFNSYIKTLLERKNSITGKHYRYDPTIMSWQLANEPRPGDGQESEKNLPAYYNWIKETAALIKSLAPYQLVSVGSEGTMGCLGLAECVISAHEKTNIDYFTFHMWLKNWGWFDVKKPAETYGEAIRLASEYIESHLTMAEELNMPAVLEEFGLERDSGEFSPAATTHYRDKYYTFVFEKLIESVNKDGSFAGANFWAWGGYGKARHEDAKWRKGDKAFVGDPPQEPQGLNSVFVTDVSTLKILVNYSDQLEKTTSEK